KREEIFHWLKLQHYNIILLQETYSIESDEKKCSTEWSGSCYFSNYRNNSAGVAILFQNIPIASIEIKKEIAGRYLCLNIMIENRYFIISHIYAPNHDSPEFFQDIFETLFRDTECPVLLGGDFNLVMDL
ncbi:hypothetical protein LOTGIDRAFT_58917, partial [Lottia gigantea]